MSGSSSNCSITNCKEEGITFFNPALCSIHWEVVLLVSRCERQGLPVTVENLLAIKHRCLVRWQFMDHELPALLQEIQAVPA